MTTLKDTILAYKILIIIPTFNEEKNITTVLNKLKALLLSFDIIVIDDCSTDNTKAVVQSNNIPVVSLAHNLGIGGAVKTGLKIAKYQNYDYAIQIDGDGQHDPAEVEKLLFTAISEKCDLVIGSRYLKKGEYQSKFFRWIGKEIFSWAIFKLTKLKISDPTSGFRVFNKRAISLFSQNYDTEYPEVGSLFIGQRKGLHIKEISVKMHHRIFGLSSINWYKGFYYMIKINMFLIVLGIFQKKEGKCDF